MLRVTRPRCTLLDVPAALLALLVLVTATRVDPGPISLEGEARIEAAEADAGDALRTGADLSVVPSAPAPRRVAVSEAQLALTPVRALRPRATPHVDRRTHRRRIPRMTVDGAADH